MIFTKENTLAYFVSVMKKHFNFETSLNVNTFYSSMVVDQNKLECLSLLNIFIQG